MDSKSNELSENVLSAITGGLSSTSVQEGRHLENNERALIMKDLLQGLSFGPVAPECTDVRR